MQLMQGGETPEPDPDPTPDPEPEPDPDPNPNPDPEPDPEPDDVENIHTKKDVYFTADAQLIAPEALEISVYDVNGKLLIIEAKSTINLSTLNRGIYLVRSIYIDGSVQMTKIIR